MYSLPEPHPGPTRRRLCSMLCVLGWPAPAPGDELRRIRPPHDVSRDPRLASILEELRNIVARKDHAALTRLMRPDFRVEFDEGQGPAAFRRRWRVESKDDLLWDVLGRLLEQGGTFYSETLFVLPYTFANFPFDLDPLSYVVATGDKVAVLAQPQRDAAKRASLDHVIVPLAQPLSPPVVIPSGRFLEVIHPEQGRCFVSSQDVYNPAAHRAFFEKRNGRWCWLSLAAATLADPPALRQPAKRT